MVSRCFQVPDTQSIDQRLRYSIESGELAFEPKPLSVMIQKLPSGIVLMPEWPWIGWPLNGSLTPVSRSNDLPITVPSASTRLPVVYLPDVWRSTGASAGAGM